MKEDIGMIVGVAEKPTVLVVDDIVTMIVEVTGGYALSRVCIAGGGIVSMTVGVGVPGGSTVCMTFGVPEEVKILTLVAEVTEGVSCSVCFVHAWGEEGGKGDSLCTFIVY